MKPYRKKSRPPRTGWNHIRSKVQVGDIKRIVAFDPSINHIGAVVIDDWVSIIDARTINPKGVNSAKFANLAELVRTYLRGFEPDYVIMEEPSFVSRINPPSVMKLSMAYGAIAVVLSELYPDKWVSIPATLWTERRPERMRRKLAEQIYGVQFPPHAADAALMVYEFKTHVVDLLKGVE